MTVTFPTEAMLQDIRRRVFRRYDEDNMQRACIRWFDLHYPAYRLLLHHSPNEGLLPKGVRDGAKRKAMGCRAGFPDLILLRSCAAGAFLAIELKTEKGRLSDSQKAYQQAVERLSGGRYIVCRSLDEFAAIVRVWMKAADEDTAAKDAAAQSFQSFQSSQSSETRETRETRKTGKTGEASSEKTD